MITLKHTALGVAGLLIAVAPARAQTSPAPRDADYDQDRKCLGVYMFMIVSERAVPPSSLQSYIDLFRADGRALGKTEAQIQADQQAAMLAYTHDVVMPQSKNDRVPDSAGWDDFKACNAWYSARGVKLSPQTPPQTKPN